MVNFHRQGLPVRGWSEARVGWNPGYSIKWDCAKLLRPRHRLRKLQRVDVAPSLQCVLKRFSVGAITDTYSNKGSLRQCSSNSGQGTAGIWLWKLCTLHISRWGLQLRWETRCTITTQSRVSRATTFPLVLNIVSIFRLRPTHTAIQT